MTLSFSYSTFLISLPLLLLFPNHHVHAIDGNDHHSNVTAQVVETICQTTIDSLFCLLSLTPHLVNETSLPQLANFTIDEANSLAVGTEKNINSTIEYNEDPSKKEGYVACSKHYADAIGDLNDASRGIARGLYGDVKNSAQSAIEEARSCESKKPVGDDMYLHERNETLEKHCSVIVALADYLLKERID